MQILDLLFHLFKEKNHNKANAFPLKTRFLMLFFTFLVLVVFSFSNSRAAPHFEVFTRRMTAN